MKKIYDRIEIETWKTIAQRVQQLNIVSGTEEEFQSNLLKLNIILQELEIERNIGKRTPKLEFEVGMSSLLQAIYDCNVPNNYKKATFYEKIYQLSDLGARMIEFSPHGINKSLPIKTEVQFWESLKEIEINKVYTNSMFNVRKEVNANSSYILENLMNPNYLLEVNLWKKADKLEDKISAVIYATLRTFNETYPSKEEIMKFEFPELAVPKQILIWGESPRVKEKFETFDAKDASYQKRLRKDDNGQYYYE